MSGTMGFAEFKDLWQALNAWKNIFMSFDRDRSGMVEAQEMQQAIKSLGTWHIENDKRSCVFFVFFLWPAGAYE